MEDDPPARHLMRVGTISNGLYLSRLTDSPKSTILRFRLRFRGLSDSLSVDPLEPSLSLESQSDEPLEVESAFLGSGLLKAAFSCEMETISG